MGTPKRKKPAGAGGPDSRAVESVESVANSPSFGGERKVDALSYAERGWRVFPVHGIDADGHCTCGKADCSDVGKHPVPKNGLKAATADAKQIKEWWAANPAANVGIRTGQVSGITVLDIDIGKKGGAETWAKLIAGHGEPQTLMALTGSGGFHVFFKYNSALKTTSNALGPGVDCRNDDGYIVAPPSSHESGQCYSWLNNEPLADLPAHLTRKPPKERDGKKGGRKHTLEEAREMLEHISPDDRDTWRNVGIILGREFAQSDEAWGIYQEWADTWDGKKGRNHDEIMREAFYEKSREDGELSMGTILHLAREGGWTDGRWRFELVPANELEVRSIDWLVKGLLERDTLAQIYGKVSSAKSFAAIDLACCIANGIDYHGRAVKQGAVVYIAGEGMNGITRRLTAWSIHHKVPLSGNVYVSKAPARMTDVDSVMQVLGAIDAAVKSEEGPALVVFDTQARNFGPGNENAQEDMTTFVRHCDEIRVAHRCCVLLVHHSGHGPQDRGRGSSVLDGALDVSYRMERKNDDVVVVKPSKPPKDAVAPQSFAFQFRSVELGFKDEDGTQATSAVLYPVPVPEAKGPQGKHQEKALALLEEMERQGPVQEDEWRERCKKAHIGGKNPNRPVDALIEAGSVVVEGGYVKAVF